ncbi:MAG TPA: DNA/RNA non-specific endonuclease [Pirellulaceae bacterium]|jgi:DNA/RNA endonuclease G (NUC1)|nr:DNA/RNA non-specific endonuclease [Pirellulaceae bacterium]
MRQLRFLFALVGLPFVIPLQATELRPIILDPSYEHDKFETQPQDQMRAFRAYTSSFDGADDDDGDGEGDAWGIPEWVSYEIREAPGGVPSAFEDRPSPWMHDQELVDAGLCPTDDSYRNSGYERGHMCQREIARRLGQDADWNSHTLINACPQHPDMNGGVWFGLERMTSAWADRYGSVWVICGPVIYGWKPKEQIGDIGEMPVAVPDAFYKIVVKETEGGGVDVLAFLVPQHGVANFSSSKHPLIPYLTSVDTIEALTGLDFLTNVAGAEELERVSEIELWPTVVASPLVGPLNFAPTFAPADGSPLMEHAIPQEHVPAAAVPSFASAPPFTFPSVSAAPAFAISPSQSLQNGSASILSIRAATFAPAPPVVIVPAPCCQPCPPPRRQTRFFGFGRR